MATLVVSIAVAVVTASAGLGAQGQPPREYGDDCTRAGCHDDLSKRAVPHSPAEEGACDSCHKETSEQHKFGFVTDKASLCYECHEQYEGDSQHAPVSQGRCTDCHDPHGSEAAFLLKAPTTAKLCEACHAKITQRKYLHGPAATGTCNICHTPHASDHAGLLVAENRALCVTCHTTIDARINAGTHQHGPVMGECISCHDAHGGDNRMNLKMTPPELCIDCHDGIGDIIDEATVKHDAVTTGTACLGCHDAHVSNVELLLLMEPMDLCLSCHNKKVKSGEVELVDIAKLLKDNPDHHGPIREKNCTACHSDVHGGRYFRLLLGEYPPEFYAPFDEARYAFCFKCHEADLVRDKETDKLTNFRNGKWNQHYVHVNRKVKGRTCRACHDTHASKKPRHITETVPFGQWDLPVNYEPADTGGSCLPGCHKRYQYDREKEVANLPPE